MRISCIIIILSLAACFSCRQSIRSKSEKIVTEWTGKVIILPEGIICLTIDSIMQCPKISETSYKILLYTDSIGCMSCRLGLKEWKKIINESDTLFVEKPEFIFVFQPKQNGEKDIRQILKQYGFTYPVFLDIDNKTYALNNFPKEPKYQCFLLDKENKVVMVGNPVYNPAIWELYKKIIRENGNTGER